MAKGHVEERFDKRDSQGVYKLENPTGPGPRYGDSGQPWRGFNPTERNRAWAPPRKLCERLGIDVRLPTRQKLDALLEAGRIELPKTEGNIPMLKVYLEDDEEQGTAYQDIWTYQSYTQGYYYGDPHSCIDQDVAPIGPTSGERLGYQTQKPQGLLDRIIRSSCPEDGILLDPFCGCGTAIHAAQKLGRQWIGIDITHLAISTIEKRLNDAFPGIHYSVHGTPKDLDGAKSLADLDKYQFQWWAVSLVDAIPYGGKRRGADTGIDGHIPFKPDGRTTEKAIVSVKGGSNVSVPMIRELGNVVDREKAKIGLFITLAQPTKPMETEAIKAGFYETPYGKFPKIQILTIEELFKGKKPQLPWRDPSSFRQARREDTTQQEKLF